MFDFEKLDLYQEIRGMNARMMKWVLYHPTMDDYFVRRFKVLLTGIAAKLSEGTARMGIQEKKKCYTDSRVNVFECVTLLHVMRDTETISEEEFDEFYQELDKISRMLLGMIRSQRSHKDRDRRRDRDRDYGSQAEDSSIEPGDDIGDEN